MQLVLASHNAGKLAELRPLLAPLGVELVSQGALGIAEAEEPFHTFLENALAKARHAARASGLPALADDAGLCVDAFGGLPGVDTAHYGTQHGFPGEDGPVLALLQNMQGGAMMAGMITLVMGLIFYTAFSNAYEGTRRKTLDREIFTSDVAFIRGRDGKLRPYEGMIEKEVVEPLFFEDIDGERTQVQIRFTTLGRTAKMIALGIVVIFLPVIVAFVLSGFDFQSLDVAGSAVWLCIFVPVVPAYYIKMGRIDIYENPYVWRIDEHGRKRRVRTESRTTTVTDVVKMLLSPGLIV